jgi:hypothetical protein
MIFFILFFETHLQAFDIFLTLIFFSLTRRVVLATGLVFPLDFLPHGFDHYY